MQKKGGNKTITMVCGALFIGALTATSALAVVACGSTDGNNGPVEKKITVLGGDFIFNMI